ncbi:MAG TPA: hypothetical protein VIY96_10765 [Thermoanaerobaculia bacterium]
MSEIGLVEVSAGVQALAGGLPVEFGDSAPVLLRFLISLTGVRSLEAVRNARRALIREEATRGREPDEPSLEDAVFTAREIRWEVRPGQRRWCLEKLEELRRRANQLLTEIEPD